MSQNIVITFSVTVFSIHRGNLFALQMGESVKLCKILEFQAHIIRVEGYIFVVQNTAMLETVTVRVILSLYLCLTVYLS